MLAFNVICSIILGVFFAMTVTKAQRGTNTVTRFVRNTVGDARMTYIIGSALSVTVITLLFAKSFLYAIPSLAILILSFIYKFKDNKDKQRVKDARMVTKRSLEVGEGASKGTGKLVGAVAGGAALGAAGVAVGAKVGSKVGKGAGKGFGAAARAMTDIEGDSSYHEAGQCLGEACEYSYEKLQDLASRAGIDVSKFNEDGLKEYVINSSAPVMVGKLKPGLTDGQKAIALLEGTQAAFV